MYPRSKELNADVVRVAIGVGVVEVDEVANVALDVVAWHDIAVLGGGGELLWSRSVNERDPYAM